MAHFDSEDERVNRTYSLPRSLHALIRKAALRKTGGNRTAMAEHYIRLGMAAEAAGWAPPGMEAAAGQAHIPSQG